jgi:hypothetical protein
MKYRNQIKMTFVATLISLGLVACKKDNVNNNANQKIYFEHYAINYAWGLSYVHWIIDDEGNVRINRKRDSIIWINSNELNKYLNYFDTIIYKVDRTDFNQFVNMIEKASQGRIDSTSRMRADFGGIVFNCYYYDKTKNRYNSVLLSEMSDLVDKTNTDSSAIKIDLWLKNIHAKIYSKK